MGRKIVITEEQYNMLMKEDISIKADVAAANGDVNKAVQTAKQEARKNNVNLNNASIEIPASQVGESKIFTMKQLRKQRLHMLRENSQYFTLNEFFKKLN